MYTLHRLRLDIHPSICHFHLSSDLRLSQTILFSVETNILVKWQQRQAVHPHNCTAKLRWDSRLAYITTLQLLQANCGKVAKICRFVNHTTLSLRLIIFDTTNYIQTRSSGTQVHRVGGQRNWSENGWWEGGGATKGCWGLQRFLLCPIPDRVPDSSFHGTM